MKKNTVLLGIALLLLVTFAGCTQNNASSSSTNTTGLATVPPNNTNANQRSETMQLVQKGDTISVNYRGTLQDGTEFDSSLKTGRTPLEFTVGSGQMIKGFDAAVVGMKQGEEKTVTLAPADAYGEIKPDRIVDVPKEKFGDLFDKLTVGQELQTSNGMTAKVVEKTATSAKMDFNHPLAGKKLTFWIKIEKIQKTA